MAHLIHERCVAVTDQVRPDRQRPIELIAVDDRVKAA
ncbi:MAG: hypothetical protein QOG77_2960 [Solirubrobacteraceae bacterium]|jgi:hypothetical protein|nr:hypothetical protein [Solirubrobacteraceae bacterium]